MMNINKSEISLWTKNIVHFTHSAMFTFLREYINGKILVEKLIKFLKEREKFDPTDLVVLINRNVVRLHRIGNKRFIQKKINVRFYAYVTTLIYFG